jgi:hypothetical protein
MPPPTSLASALAKGGSQAFGHGLGTASVRIRPTLAADWAVAAGTGALAIATFLLARQASRQVVALQRPLVYPIVNKEWEKFGQTQSRVWIKNGGQGPAYNAQGTLYWTGGAGGASSLVIKTLAPSEEVETRVIGEGININWAAASGYIRYFDLMDAEWITHFRFEAVEGSGTRVLITKVGRLRRPRRLWGVDEPKYSPEGPAPGSI